MKPRRLIGFGSVLMAAVMLAQAGYIDAKAIAAQALLNRAFDQLNRGNPHHKPWPWADFSVRGRLQSTPIGLDAIVLSDPSARHLAFGPTQQTIAVPGGEAQLLSAHRDLSFAALGAAQIGDELTLDSGIKPPIRYAVASIQVLPTAAFDPSAVPVGALVLSTCYPLNGVDPNGPRRLLVIAERKLSDDRAPGSNL
jgi:sortase A